MLGADEQYDRTMGNPASELAELFSKWRVVPIRSNVYQTRDASAPGDLDFWQAQVRAAELLSDVTAVIRAVQLGGKDMSHYGIAQVAWYRAVFAPDVAWNQASGSDSTVIDEASVNMLRSLADIIDLGGFSVPMDVAAKAGIEAAVDEVLALLADADGSLDVREKRYVYELISSIRRVLSESRTFGGVDLLRRVHELFGYLTVLADQLSDAPETENLAQKLRSAARRVVGFLRFGTGFASSSLSSLADLHQITGGT